MKKVKSRKELRRELRGAKKQNRANYRLHPSQLQDTIQHKEVGNTPTISHPIKKKKRKRKNIHSEFRENRNLGLTEANEIENREIRALEKKLKLNRKRKRTATEVETSTRKELDSIFEELGCINSDEEVEEVPVKKKKVRKTKVIFDEDEGEVSAPKVVKEDIYGRDVRPIEPDASFPTELDDADVTWQCEDERLLKLVRSSVNKLSDSNMVALSGTITQLYQEHPRPAVTAALVSCIFTSYLPARKLPDKFLTQISLFVSALHSLATLDITGLLLTRIVVLLKAHFQESDSDVGRVCNAACILSNLANFSALQPSLIFEVAASLATRFSEADVAVLHVLLKHAGFLMRRSDPSRLKELFSELQAKADSTDTAAFEDPLKVRFMIDALVAVKNNNAKKLSDVDVEFLAQCNVMLRQLKGGHSEPPLHASLSSLLTSDLSRRWWIVQESGANSLLQPVTDTHKEVEQPVDSRVLKAAKKLRMTTVSRKAIFCIIVTSSDYMEAFGKLFLLGYKAQQQREFVQVAVECCLHEKVFNPYYQHLLSHLSRHSRQLRVALQFCIWDKWRSLDSLAETELVALGHLLAGLLSSATLPITVLKTLEFADLSQPMMSLLNTTFSEYLKLTEETTIQTQLKPLLTEKFSELRKSLALYLRHFLQRTLTAQPTLLQRLEHLLQTLFVS